MTRDDSAVDDLAGAPAVGPPADADLEVLQNALVGSRPEGLREHRRPIACMLRDPGGALLAGIAGHTQFDWLCIEKFWVDEVARGVGLGTRLLSALEQGSRERGVVGAWVDTFSFQARPFYEAHGYRLFGEIEDFPAGHRRLFLSKRF